MVVGRYFPGNSLIHRLDPRAKLITGFAFILILLLTTNWLTYLGLILFTAILMKLSGIPFAIFRKGVRPLLVIIVFTSLLQLFFSGGGQVFFRFGAIRITEGGIIQAINVFLRFTLTIFMSITVSITTRPIEFTDAVESLLSPLRYLNVPVQDVALMLSIALRFIPTLMDESQRIMKAQQSRGVEFGEGNIYQQMKALIPVFLPLFVSSFYRAEELGNALDVRGYQGDRRRTKLRVRHWQLRDTFYLLSFALVSFFVITFR
ncbi:MAG: energy-coupling factor transporter transmembrane protein EcfT [Turicibacter sp.]|nr:energy-coupling factor transporter transmembrane protein EcfT [Turicibacter sp.]